MIRRSPWYYDNWVNDIVARYLKLIVMEQPQEMHVAYSISAWTL